MPTESFELEVKFPDKISPAADKASRSIKKLDDEIKKLEKDLSFGSDVDKLGKQLQKLYADPKGFREMLALQKKLREERKRLAGEDKPQGFWSSFTKALPYRSIAQYTQAAFLGNLLASGVTKIGETLIGSVKTAVSIFTDGIKEAGKLETLRTGYKLSLGEKGGGAALEDIGRFAGRTGFDDDTIAQLILPLRRAGLEQKAARQAFATAADIAAGEGQGGNLGRIQGLMDAFTTIRLKGGITKKMLPGLGVDAREFFKELAKRLGVSEKEAEKRAEEGTAGPQRLLNIITEQVNKRQGGEAGAGSEAYGKTFEGLLTKVQALPSNYLKTIVDSPGFAKLKERLAGLLDQLNPDGPRGQKFIKSLMNAFTAVIGFIDRVFTAERIDKFIEKVVTLGDTFKTIVGYLDDAVSIAEIFATIWGGQKLITGLSGAAQGIQAVTASIAEKGGLRAAFNGAIGAAGAVTLALGSVAFAYERITRAAEELGGWTRVAKDVKDWWNDKPALASDAVNENSPQWKKDKARGTNVNAPMVFNLNVPQSQDPTHTGQVLGDVIYKHASNSVERAAGEQG